MDLNSLKKQRDEANQRVIDYTSKAGGFADELKKAIEQNDATYKPFENDVNSSRNTYYNSTEQLLPQLTSKYGTDPQLALQALGNERSILGTRYQNAQDSLQRRKGGISDLIDSYNRSAQTELQRQSSLAQLLGQQYQEAFQEDQARRAAAAQSAYLNGLLNGQDGSGKTPPPGYKVGDKLDGKTIIGFDANGNPVFAEDQADKNGKNIFGQIADFTGNKDSVNNVASAIQIAAQKSPLAKTALGGLLTSGDNLKNTVKAGVGGLMPSWGANALSSLFNWGAGR